MATIRVDEVVANSYKNFHAKGLDYLCLSWSPELTLKLYMYNGDPSKMSEVVNPHNHRYDFKTTCLAGEVINCNYRKGTGSHYNEFLYDTPLNGGSGFTWKGTLRLSRVFSERFRPGESYMLCHDYIHTVEFRESENVLLLEQYADLVPVGIPTSTFCISDEPPLLDGLYERFTPDEVVTYLRRLSDKTGAEYDFE